MQIPAVQIHAGGAGGGDGASERCQAGAVVLFQAGGSDVLQSDIGCGLNGELTKCDILTGGFQQSDTARSGIQGELLCTGRCAVDVVFQQDVSGTGSGCEVDGCRECDGPGNVEIVVGGVNVSGGGDALGGDADVAVGLDVAVSEDCDGACLIDFDATAVLRCEQFVDAQIFTADVETSSAAGGNWSVQSCKTIVGMQCESGGFNTLQSDIECRLNGYLTDLSILSDGSSEDDVTGGGFEDQVFLSGLSTVNAGPDVDQADDADTGFKSDSPTLWLYEAFSAASLSGTADGDQISVQKDRAASGIQQNISAISSAAGASEIFAPGRGDGSDRDRSTFCGDCDKPAISTVVC